MINTIIFDFGDVFVNLNYQAANDAFRKLGLESMPDDVQELNLKYEVGAIDEEQFQKHIPHASLIEIRTAWNSLIGDFPLERLEFLQMLCGKYKLLLLSNTDQTHIDHFEHKAGMTFAKSFYQCFEKVYFSFEAGRRKPDPEIFQMLVRKHGLEPERTLFIDDRTANTDVAASLGMRVWNLIPGEEDVTELFDKKLL
jgi:FMN phosphatase YigB (HAD superfamily)